MLFCYYIHKLKITVYLFCYFSYTTTLNEGQGSTSANSLRDSKGCPDGFDSLEVCYSRDCVTETISDFMVENASQIENGATVSIKLEDAALGGKRVCGRVSLDSEQ